METRLLQCQLHLRGFLSLTSRTAPWNPGGRKPLVLCERTQRTLSFENSGALGAQQSRGFRVGRAGGMEWIKESPKVELHVHLDGAFCTDILWRLAKYPSLIPGSMPPL